MPGEPTRDVTPSSPLSPDAPSSAVADVANGIVIGIARHWLAIFNVAWGMYVLLPILAAVGMQMGWTTPASIIYRVYSFTCHQLPDHSYFLFGPSLVPGTAELEAAGMPGYNLFEQRTFIGNERVGYKVALCQRDMAIYGTVFVAGLVFGLLRRRLRALPFKVYLLFLIPIAVDGGSQLFGLRESNWWLRSVTGAIFGAASVWLAYPFIEDAMQDVIDTELAAQRQRPPSTPVA
jgi:uncharacterized membrane protein